MSEIKSAKEARGILERWKKTIPVLTDTPRDSLRKAQGGLDALKWPEVKRLTDLLESFAKEWDENAGPETPIQIIRRIERNAREALDEFKDATGG